MVPGAHQAHLAQESLLLEDGTVATLHPVGPADYRCRCGHYQSYHTVTEVNGDRDSGCWVLRDSGKPCLCSAFRYRVAWVLTNT